MSAGLNRACGARVSAKPLARLKAHPRQGSRTAQTRYLRGPTELQLKQPNDVRTVRAGAALEAKTDHRHRPLQADVPEAARPAPSEEIIPGDELIELTKRFLSTGFAGPPPELLSDDMIYRGPELGPLTKDQYVDSLKGFKLEEAFPDAEMKTFGFSVDPTDPFRVWYFSQTTGTHTGDFRFAGSVYPPTGGKVQNGVEANSVIFTPDRKVKYISVGYCCDRINSNTPNGTMKVAVVGFLRAAGKAEVFGFIMNPVVGWVLRLVYRLQGKPNPQVPFEELPEWWQKLPDGRLRNNQQYLK